MKLAKKPLILLALAAAFATALLALPGCFAAPSANTEQSANVTYMSQAHSSMEELAETLQAFDDAVARKDVVTMRTQADNAAKTIDEFTALDAPMDLVEVRQDYVDGCEALEGALSDYVALFADINSATEEHPFDYSTYDSRLQSIQQAYDQGIQKLQDGDQKAIAMQDE